MKILTGTIITESMFRDDSQCQMCKIDGMRDSIEHILSCKAVQDKASNLLDGMRQTLNMIDHPFCKFANLLDNRKYIQFMCDPFSSRLLGFEFDSNVPSNVVDDFLHYARSYLYVAFRLRKDTWKKNQKKSDR